MQGLTVKMNINTTIEMLENQDLSAHNNQANELMSAGVMSIMSNPAKIKTLVTNVISSFQERDKLYLSAIKNLNMRLEKLENQEG